jgi:ankyrin repeat protein
MSTSTLPAVPSLEQLKNQAKDLTKRAKARDADAARRFAAHLPRLADANLEAVFSVPPTLAEAQLVVAREHGFASWPKLRRHVETLAPDFDAAFDAFKRAVREGDSARAKRLLNDTPGLKDRINDPWDHFDSPAILGVASRGDRAMLDVLLAFGADINAKSTWWAGGFGVLPCPDRDFGAYLIERGATVNAYAASGMDMLDKLAELVEADPACVNMRGGDGQTPLHVAASVRIAEYLLDHGAEIDTRDIDHGSTPAQYLAAERPEVCRYLLSRGAKPDIFMAVQLGDLALVRKILTDDPAALRARVGAGKFTSGSSNGGHIYLYTLRNAASPLYLAADLGHGTIYADLFERVSPAEQMLAALMAADEPAVNQVLAANPGLMSSLDPEYPRGLPHAAWGHKTETVRLALKVGFPIDVQDSEGCTALNRAAIRGYTDLVELLLTHGASLEVANNYGGRPLGACLWGAVNFRDPNGDYPRTVELLLAAGAQLRDISYPCANKPVNAVLRRHLEKLAKTNVIAAIKLGGVERVRALLDAVPETINRKTSGILPLYQAVWSGQAEIARLLIERGADVELRMEEGGVTVREEAEKAGDAEIVETLRARLNDR